MKAGLGLWILAIACLAVGAALGDDRDRTDPVDAVAPPPHAAGYPSRDANLDALPGFANPPPGYGEVPYWWWTGDPLDVERLVWQLDQLHRKGISGVQVNYAHEDSPGWPTYATEPPIFSPSWWRIWGRVADECRRRGMGIGLSTYTLDWPAGNNLFRRLFYSKPELNALKLQPLPRRHLKAGQSVAVTVPADLIAARAYRVAAGRPQAAGLDLMPQVRDGRLQWTAPEGQWELWLVRAEPQPNTLNPLLTGIGQIVIRDFYQRFQDATPNKSHQGLNYFFNDELNVGAGTHVWNADFAAEFRRRKGYDLMEALPALWGDVGPATPKVRMDYADVRMALMEERYFQPIYRWHASRGLIFACDSGGRGRRPDEFGDYFRATRWYTAPGHDTPGGSADLIKGKVSSSIASLYRRPRVWLEGYHSLGWGATPERLMQATRENYLYGCTLLNLHGLYYTTHGSFWEWAPPCYHFRMPYWEHMGVFLKYFDRLSYLLSQGSLVCEVAIVYPVAPFEAGLDGKGATQTAFATAATLMAAGVNFEFVDADSLARASVREEEGTVPICRNGPEGASHKWGQSPFLPRLTVADSSYRVLIFPAMEAARWSSLEKARDFAKSGGLLLGVGALPLASDRAGRNDKELDALVSAAFAPKNRLAKPADVPAAILAAFTPDTRAEKPVRSLHRKIGPRHVYMVMDAPKGSTVEFRAQGLAELWDPWSGQTRPLRVLGQTATGTRVEMPLEDYEAQIVVFTPGRPHVNPPPRPDRPSQKMALNGQWEFELKPTMDNRFGDFRLPAVDKVIGPEARIFRHAVESGDAAAWRASNFDDSRWERATYDFGPQFWLLGPLPADADAAALDAELASLTRVDPNQSFKVAGKPARWRPYSFSWRQGLQGDPGHQGWHGLKENVSDHFLCLGKRAAALNEFKYEPEPSGNRYYLWTSATVDRPTTARILASNRQAGGQPHASDVLTPAAVYLNGTRVGDLQHAVSLRAGVNPLLVRYDRAGRGYFVLKRDADAAKPSGRTPLAMTWFDDPRLIRFDVHAGRRSAEWFRFTAPPGLCAMIVRAKGTVEAWADGQPMRAGGQGRFETPAPLPRAALVALRVVPETGVCGAAVFPDPIRLECGPGLAALGDWSKAGALECYSGGAWYRKTVTLSAQQARGPVALDLGKVVATAEVRVNGQLAGVRVAPPWRVDISKYVQPGENRFEVLVYNTLANHYLTIPTRYRGELTSGLLGPVVLEVPPGPDSLSGAESPRSVAELWADFDPRKDPLETQVIRQWKEDGVTLRCVRFLVGTFKGRPARLAAFYGFPEGTQEKLPGVMHIHGGGQRANLDEVRLLAARGYAALSVNWGGREMEDAHPGDPNTDWGAVDPTQTNVPGYHSFQPGPKQFFDDRPHPKNCNWYLLTLACRRGLTFLEGQPQVDPARLGVHGYSMGGNLTMYVAGTDPRVKCAVPGVGGQGWRSVPHQFLEGVAQQEHIQGDVDWFRRTLSFESYAPLIRCPVLHRSATNDFHGWMDDVYRTNALIEGQPLRYAWSPHFNHRLTPEVGVAMPLWFDHFLKGGPPLPPTPASRLTLASGDGVPEFRVQPAPHAWPVTRCDIYYSTDPDPRARFWRSAEATRRGDAFTAALPLETLDRPLFAFANVDFKLPHAETRPYPGAMRTTGVGELCLSTLFHTAAAAELRASGVKPTGRPTLVLEDFAHGLRDWYSLNADHRPLWQHWTRKVTDPKWRGPDGASLALTLTLPQANRLTVVVVENEWRNYRGPRRVFVCRREIAGKPGPQTVTLAAADFKDPKGNALPNWRQLDQLALCAHYEDREHKAPAAAAEWHGPLPRFHRLEWIVSTRP